MSCTKHGLVEPSHKRNELTNSRTFGRRSSSEIGAKLKRQVSVVETKSATYACSPPTFSSTFMCPFLRTPICQCVVADATYGYQIPAKPTPMKITPATTMETTTAEANQIGSLVSPILFGRFDLSKNQDSNFERAHS